MSRFSASVRDLNALVCSPPVSPIVSPISINVVCRMIFHVHVQYVCTCRLSLRTAHVYCYYQLFQVNCPFYAS